MIGVYWILERGQLKWDGFRESRYLLDTDIWKKSFVFSDHLLSLILTFHPSNRRHHKGTNQHTHAQTMHTKKYKFKCGEKNLLSLDILKPISGEYTTKRKEVAVPNPIAEHHHEGVHMKNTCMSSSVGMLKRERRRKRGLW
ncbi:hypothetical protein EYC84_006364 [Monilinia fructicola]|uniref:Uncharacterized protein n=1 Tax=Monilinia fructicola TaxID=38448 RepID=A0A5M9K3P9_MONFR|nr:hypothetical protein EYC84_006364 [Monilinia fructicola]